MKESKRKVSDMLSVAPSLSVTNDVVPVSAVLKLILLGRPPWITRQFRRPFICVFSVIYGLLLIGFLYATAKKIRMEYRHWTIDVTSVRLVMLGHDTFILFGVIFLTMHGYVQWPDKAIRICIGFNVLKSHCALLRLIVLNIPCVTVLVVNLYWQTIVFSAWTDIAEATCHHLVSIGTWNGLWVYVIIRLWLFNRQLQNGTEDSIKTDLLSMLANLEELNGELGLYLLLLIGKSVFDAISSLTFYSLQESSLPQILLAHEALVIFYDLIFCALSAELATRISAGIRFEFSREAPVLAKVNQSMAIGGGALSWPLLAAHCPVVLPQGIDAFGVFTLNRSFFVTLCGTTLTFLLILVQFSPEVQKKISLATI